MSETVTDTAAMPEAVVDANLPLPKDLFWELDELAQEGNQSRAEALQNGVAAHKFLQRHRAAENTILIQKPGEKKPSRVVVFK